MKIKVFTTDQKGYITLTQKELQDLLNEAYWEGYHEGEKPIPTYPIRPSPYYWTTTTTGNLSIKAEDMKPYSISYDTKIRGK